MKGEDEGRSGFRSGTFKVREPQNPLRKARKAKSSAGRTGSPAWAGGPWLKEGSLVFDRFPSAALASLGLALLLGSCAQGGLKATLGLSNEGPDALAVTTQPSLTLPPDFALRPPEPGAPRPQEMSPAQSAEAALVPQSVLDAPVPAESSPGQQALIGLAGPPPPPNIRAEIDRETALSHPPQSFVDDLMFWKPAPEAGIVVDPTRETQRLREDAALGQPVTAGTTPIIQPQQHQGLGQRLFGWLF